jgi:hypothetical protein
VTEREPHETGIDGLLRRSLAAPVPSLPLDFDQRVMRELRQRSAGQSSQHRSSSALDRYGWILLTGYGLISVAVSAVVMRGQGLQWGAIAVMTLAPLISVATVTGAGRAIRTTMRHSTK